jgi:16S rRNA (guanine966-N2)-methyltransferase
MRVIGGRCKGSIIKSPRGLATRPLLARIKKALFSILHPYLPGARFLDLFAGTGSVGIEALSRGAASCVFVESDNHCVDIIRDNLHRLMPDHMAKVVRADVFKSVRHFQRVGETFDIIFVGPPYGRGLEHRTLDVLGKSEMLASHGIVVVQSRKDESLLDQYVHLSLARTRIYGDTKLWFYEARPESLPNHPA